MKKKILSIIVLLALCLSFSGIVWAKSLVASDFTKTTAPNATLTFSRRDFLNAVNPPSGYSLTGIRLTQLTNPVAGVLRIGTSAAKTGSTISLSSLDKLNFVPTKDYKGEAIFTWYAIFGKANSPYPGAVIITVGGKADKNSQAQNTPQSTEQPTAAPETKNEDSKPEKTPQTKSESTPKPTPVPTSEPLPKPTLTPKQSEKSEPSPAASPEPTLKPLKYDDMDNHWAAYSAGLLATKGYFIGEEIGDRFFFYPDKVMNRIDFILMVNSIFGIKAKDSIKNNPFSDKNVPDYILRHAIAAYEEGVICGEGAGKKLQLLPYKKITRAEAIKILDNALKLKHKSSEPTEFYDSNAVPEWCVEATRNMEAYGIIRGFSDNTIRPNECITKAESAEMIYQTLKYLEKVRKTRSVFNFVKGIIK